MVVPRGDGRLLGMTTDRTRSHVRAGAPPSAAARWPALRRFIAAEQRFARRCSRHPAGQVAYEFVRFGVKQAWACLFGALLLALLLATHLWYPRDALLPRYDAILIGAVAIQAAMLMFGLETREEARVILVFHVVGTIMEIFKTAAGSWAYPEPSFARIGGVPLFSGFMYAAVGSYIARVWRLFDFQFTRHPPVWALAILSTAIYVNFFAHHFVTDIRLALFAGAALAFGPAVVHFRVWRVHRSMPLLLGLCLVALFIWFAENLATFARAWSYPHQAAVWQPVPLTKFGAWFLLMIISYTLVAAVHGITARAPGPNLREARAIRPPATAG